MNRDLAGINRRNVVGSGGILSAATIWRATVDYYVAP